VLPCPRPTPNLDQPSTEPEGQPLTTIPAPDAGLAEVRPRKISRASTGADAVFVLGARAVGASVLVITGGVGLFLGYQAYPTLKHYGFGFFTETQWQPDQDVIGIAAVLVGTVSVAMVAMFFAFPLALLTALYISEYAPDRAKPTLVALIDLMAAVPSIVYGLWGFRGTSAGSRCSRSRTPTRTPRSGTPPATSRAPSAPASRSR
jgi:phosphate transport system permease protein